MSAEIKSQRGFTLIELMIVVAIVGILSTFAIGAYSDYTIRAKSAEILSFASSYKTDVAVEIYENGVVPTLDQIQNPTELIRRVEFWRPRDDRMVIHLYPTKAFWSGIDENVDAILLEVIIQANGTLKWSCGPHATFRNVPERYLPATCREWIDNNA
jgi:prepilin-type N-terminal cleavage/methylation domain-containing protein